MIHIILFVATLVTTTVAGIEWVQGFGVHLDPQQLKTGLPYSLSILFILGCHEFGHYFAARHHNVDVSLPYFIPFPPLPGMINFGTMGAVIRTRALVPNNRVMFDIGVYGPVAGFIASLGVLIYGFTHLPGVEYITRIHPDYFTGGTGNAGIQLRLGEPLLMAALRSVLTQANDFVPPMSEIYHYPFLCAGWFGLFITALNMIPVGQLDGGHIVYSMFGSRIHTHLARVTMGILLVMGVLGFADPLLDWNVGFGWPGWLLWAGILVSIIKVSHPPVIEFHDLDGKRLALGYASFLIFAVCFVPSPFTVF